MRTLGALSINSGTHSNPWPSFEVVLLNRLRGERAINKVVRLLVASASVLTSVGFVIRAQEPTFKVDVQLVRLLATVKDSNGQLIGNLRREDFIVHDNGVRQEVSVF